MPQRDNGLNNCQLDIEVLKQIELARTEAHNRIKEAKDDASEAEILLDAATLRKQSAKQDIHNAESKITTSLQHLETLEYRLQYDRSLRNQAIRDRIIQDLNAATEAKRAAKLRLDVAEDDIVDAEKDLHRAHMKELRGTEALQSTQCEWQRLLERASNRSTSASSTASSTVSGSSAATNSTSTSVSTPSSTSSTASRKKKKYTGIERTKSGRIFLTTLT